jgi:hypothetical protein
MKELRIKINKDLIDNISLDNMYPENDKYECMEFEDMKSFYHIFNDETLRFFKEFIRKKSVPSNIISTKYSYYCSTIKKLLSCGILEENNNRISLKYNTFKLEIL